MVIKSYCSSSFPLVNYEGVSTMYMLLLFLGSKVMINSHDVITVSEMRMISILILSAVHFIYL